MPVKFPDDLLVAEEICIQVVQSTPVNQRSTLAGNRFQMPVDRCPKVEITKGQQIKIAFRDTIGSIDDLFFRLGPTTSKFGQSWFAD